MSAHHLITTYRQAAFCPHVDPDDDPPVFDMATGAEADWAAYRVAKDAFDEAHEESAIGTLCMQTSELSCLECGERAYGYDACELSSDDPDRAVRH